MAPTPPKRRQLAAWGVEIVGFVLLVGGVALVFIPAAAVVAGVALIVAAERA